MGRHVLVLTTSAFVLTCGVLAASAQQVPDVPTMQQQPRTYRSNFSASSRAFQVHTASLKTI
jgi:hypothetical protein